MDRKRSGDNDEVVALSSSGGLKQKVLVISTRAINARSRHLMEVCVKGECNRCRSFHSSLFSVFFFFFFFFFKGFSSSSAAFEKRFQD